MNISEAYLSMPENWECQPFVDFNDKIKALAYTPLPTITMLYGMVCGLGAMGNIMIILAFVANKELRTLPNYFIVNLAVSDFVMCTMSAPFSLFMVLNTFWPFGNVACRFIAASQAVNIFVSTLTLTGIGFHR